MFSNRGSSLVSTILAVAAAGGVGVAGYYLVSGGCGSCSTDAAAVTPVAATAAEADSCCPGDVAGAAVVAVANAGEACEASCTDEQKAACETECTDEQKAACETACSGEAAVELVANQGEACTAEKSDCSAEKACDGEAKVCPVTGQPIADAGN